MRWGTLQFWLNICFTSLIVMQQQPTFNICIQSAPKQGTQIMQKQTKSTVEVPKKCDNIYLGMKALFKYIKALMLQQNLFHCPRSSRLVA